jgi:LemA protein
MFILFGAIGLLLIMGIAIYNNLVGARNQVENAFGSIDVMLKKRYDLIPNLVETAKAYMKHEKETLTSISPSFAHVPCHPMHQQTKKYSSKIKSAA